MNPASSVLLHTHRTGVIANNYPQPLPEYLAYLGIPMIILLLVAIVYFWRDLPIRVAGVTCLLLEWLGMGSKPIQANQVTLPSAPAALAPPRASARDRRNGSRPALHPRRCRGRRRPRVRARPGSKREGGPVRAVALWRQHRDRAGRARAAPAGAGAVSDQSLSSRCRPAGRRPSPHSISRRRTGCSWRPSRTRRPRRRCAGRRSVGEPVTMIGGDFIAPDQPGRAGRAGRSAMTPTAYYINYLYNHQIPGAGTIGGPGPCRPGHVEACRRCRADYAAQPAGAVPDQPVRPADDQDRPDARLAARQPLTRSAATSPSRRARLPTADR